MTSPIGITATLCASGCWGIRHTEAAHTSDEFLKSLGGKSYSADYRGPESALTYSAGWHAVDQRRRLTETQHQHVLHADDGGGSAGKLDFLVVWIKKLHGFGHHFLPRLRARFQRALHAFVKAWRAG